jgi:hypothetical protein
VDKTPRWSVDANENTVDANENTVDANENTVDGVVERRRRR